MVHRPVGVEIPIAVAHAPAHVRAIAGREAGVVSLHDYVHPASLRLEYGHTDEMSYRTIWFDVAALRREVVDSFRADGRWLPALWDERRDRSAPVGIHPRADDGEAANG